MRIIGIIVFCVVHHSITAQLIDSGSKEQWNKGSIIRKDGSNLTGFIKVNSDFGLIKFRESLDAATQEKSFQENSIVAMEYFDRQLSRQRKFASINVESKATGFKGYLLFEIVKEFRNFAVLSRTYQVSPAYNVNSNNAVYNRKEVIFVSGADGVSEILLLLSEFGRMESDRTAAKHYFNKDVLKKRIGSMWPQVKSFAKRNRLKFKRKNDLFKVFDYYGEIAENG